MSNGIKARTLKIHPSYDELHRLYVVDDKTSVEIARIYGMHHTTLLRRLRGYNIPIRTNTEIHGGKVNSLETRSKMSESSKGNKKWLGKKHTKEARAKIGAFRIGSIIPMEVRLKMSATHKKLFENPEYKSMRLKAVKDAQNKSPNNCEIMIMEMLEDIQPGIWQFVGAHGFEIDDKKPDFWNGDHKLIEHFGDYWHGPKARCYGETEKGRIEFFTKHGYKVLIIWEHDLIKHPDLVREKIKEFVNK